MLRSLDFLINSNLGYGEKTEGNLFATQAAVAEKAAIRLSCNILFLLIFGMMTVSGINNAQPLNFNPIASFLE
ncbi:MAG: hypothetical protein R2941_05960 [Desulfobacterales bacterium]